MQLVLSEHPANTADEDLEMLECTLVPSTTASLSTAPAANTDEIESQTDAGGEATQTPGQALYAAVTACADLHPDPTEDDDEEQAGLPGAGGWITSENLHEFMDEEGNLSITRDDEGLGAGAGAVRGRDEDGEEDDLAKWQRTG
jgi:chloride channel, nucleotide-sensitive, 1A